MREICKTVSWKKVPDGILLLRVFLIATIVKKTFVI